MRQLRLSPAAVAALVWFVTACVPTAGYGADTYSTAILGGTGGGLGDLSCDPSSVLVGFDYRSGSTLNTIVGLCRRVADKGLVGSTYWMAKGLGGSGGSNRPEVICPPGMAIVAMQVHTDRYNEVYAIAVWCAPTGWVYDARGWPPNANGLTATDGGQAVRYEIAYCNEGDVAVGIIARSGTLIDAIGLRCTHA
jgi:hypothetical protein